MIFRYKISFLILTEKPIDLVKNQIFGDSRNISLRCKEILQKEYGYDVELTIVHTPVKKWSDEDIQENISRELNIPIEGIKEFYKYDLLEIIKLPMMYHGTSKRIWSESSSYIFLTKSISHAYFHAKGKVDESDINDKAIVVAIDPNKLNHCDFLPDNDLGNNKYPTFIESFEDIGTICVLGEIKASDFEILEENIVEE